MKRYCFFTLMLLLAMGFVQAGEDDHHKKGEGHAHAAPHGGIVKTIGDHHAEWVVDHDGKVHLYILGDDESKARPVAAKEITAQIKVKGQDEHQAVTLKADPLKGEKDGAASHFTGTAEFLKGPKAHEAVVRVEISGKTHRATFEHKGESKAKDHGHKDEHKDGHKDEHKH